MTSMTGYGKAELSRDGRDIVIEIKTVNNRYLDINCKLPRAFISLEDAIRKIISKKVSRGRVDLFAAYTDNRNTERNVKIDLLLASGYLDAAKQLNKEFDIPDDFTTTSLMRIPDIVKPDNNEDDMEEIAKLISDCTLQAVDNLNAMRQTEGKALKEDILNRCQLMQQLTDKIKNRAPIVAEDFRIKLKERITTALENVDIDEARLLNEVAFYADKSNIDEELSRLSSHYKQLISILNSKESSGRKLDFLVQELNREVNTICSKSSDIDITNYGLQLKSEIEKIREQVQNIE